MVLEGQRSSLEEILEVLPGHISSRCQTDTTDVQPVGFWLPAGSRPPIISRFTQFTEEVEFTEKLVKMLQYAICRGVATCGLDGEVGGVQVGGRGVDQNCWMAAAHGSEYPSLPLVVEKKTGLREAKAQHNHSPGFKGASVICTWGPNNQPTNQPSS